VQPSRPDRAAIHLDHPTERIRLDMQIPSIDIVGRQLLKVRLVATHKPDELGVPTNRETMISIPLL